MNAAAQPVTSRQSLFGLFGGPLAWYLQLCAGYALASQPCFRGGFSVTAPLRTEQWIWAAMILAMLAAVAVSLLAFLVSWRTYQRSDTGAGGAAHLIETGSDRARFFALWGVFLGAAFASATAISAVAFMTLPRCAG